VAARSTAGLYEGAIDSLINSHFLGLHAREHEEGNLHLLFSSHCLVLLALSLLALLKQCNTAQHFAPRDH
jgi:uncharacterized YccA/Bax inhibitor family protein